MKKRKILLAVIRRLNAVIVVAGTLTILILAINLVNLSKENSRLKLQIERQLWDSTPAIYYFLNAYEFYESKNWNEVIANSVKYIGKMKLLGEKVNEVIYLYTSYAYYKIALKCNIDSNKYVSLGLNDIEQYNKENPNNFNSWYIRGLLFNSYPKNDQYVDKLSEAHTSFEKSLLCNPSEKQRSDASYFKGIVKFNEGLIYKDTNNQRLKEAFCIALQDFKLTKHEDADKKILEIQRIMKIKKLVCDEKF